jgi:F0F1-type ATP synthase assembly protein I
MNNDYLQLFTDTLHITTHLVLSACNAIGKFLIIIVAAALPLFLVLFILIGLSAVVVRVVFIIKGADHE